MRSVFRAHTAVMLTALLLGYCPAGCGGLLPRLDPNIRDMSITPAIIKPCPGQQHARPDRAPIPAIIHQIALTFDAPSPEVATQNSNAWSGYARTFAYAYRLWTLKDEAEFSTLLDPRCQALLRQALALHNDAYASELLRVAVLDHFGGIFVSGELSPPRIDGQWVDFRHLAPMSGLVLSTEREGKNIGTSAILVSTSLIMAAAHHPVLSHLRENFSDNHEAWVQRHAPFDARYEAGIFALNRALAGPLSIMPSTYLEALGMTQGDV